MYLLNYVISSVHTTIYTKHLIFSNKISQNISQVCQISHKFMNYDHHQSKINETKINKTKCINMNGLSWPLLPQNNVTQCYIHLSWLLLPQNNVTSMLHSPLLAIVTTKQCYLSVTFTSLTSCYHKAAFLHLHVKQPYYSLDYLSSFPYLHKCK